MKPKIPKYAQDMNRAKQCKNEERSAMMMETYKLLRSEIEMLCKSFDTYAISAVTATAVVWAWLLTHSPNVAGHELFYLAPAACALLFGVRIYAIMQAVTEIGRHLAKIEKEFGLDETTGWELYCAAERVKTEREMGVRTGSLLGLWQGVFWLVLFALNLSVGLCYMTNPCAPKPSSTSDTKVESASRPSSQSH